MYFTPTLQSAHAGTLCDSSAFVTLISIATNGTQGNVDSSLSNRPAVSDDGRYVAFWSNSNTLVPGDTNSQADVFVRDRLNCETQRVSVSSSGVQGDKNSSDFSLSSNGRYVAFQSEATNLIANDTNTCDGFMQTGECTDIFVHDRQTAQTVRVSIASNGAQANNQSFTPVISPDGRFVAFMSDATNLVSEDLNNTRDIFLHDRDTDGDGIFDESGTISTTLISIAGSQTQANNESSFQAISSDARFVAFQSSANNLVISDTNNRSDIYIRDRQTNQTSRVSIASDGTQGDNHSYFPSISADGRFVSFYSEATNLVSGDTNNRGDIFVRDRQTNVTTRVSVASDGTEGNDGLFHPGLISSTGRFVVFASDSSNLVADDTNTCASEGDGYDESGHCPDVFIYDRETGTTTRLSVSAGGVQGNSQSVNVAISSGGNFVAFGSRASNLVPGDSNNTGDVFLVRFSFVPSTPILNLPTSAATLNDKTPTFTWNTDYAVNTYQIQIDDANDFATPIQDQTVVAPTYTATSLADGLYYWRIQTVNSAGSSEWSEIRSLTINTASPPDAVIQRNYFETATPTLTWSRLSWATNYHVQVARDSNFNDIVFEDDDLPINTLEVLVNTPLDEGRYYWRVRGLKAGSAGKWSTTDSFTIAP